MFYEIVRAIVQKIFRDKILAGLVVVGILAIFVGGFGGNPGEKGARRTREARPTGDAGAPQKQDSQPAAPQKEETKAPPVEVPNPAQARLEPPLACQFIEWWVTRALDFNPQTAFKNRQEAMTWITPDALPSYQAAFWPPEISDGIAGGRIQGNFTLAGTKALASNPDGSVVVNVTGNLVLAQGQKPVVQQLSTDYLVRREAGGLRISGLFNRAVLLQGSTF